MPTFTTKNKFTIPAGKTTYYSSVMSDKMTEFKQNGNIISAVIDSISETEKTVTIVWKDESAFNSWQEWYTSAGELANQRQHNLNNSIIITKL